jgi:transcriptional regulator with XRE-family HTH domain
MDLGLTQREVALQLRANPWTYLLWEHDRHEPMAKFVARIVDFLGHDPYPSGTSFGDKLRSARLRMGLSQAELALRVGMSEATVYDLERGRQRASTPAGMRLAQFLRIECT